MKITILGTGNGGTRIAADLTVKGYSITLLKTSSIARNFLKGLVIKHRNK